MVSLRQHTRFFPVIRELKSEVDGESTFRVSGVCNGIVGQYILRLRINFGSENAQQAWNDAFSAQEDIQMRTSNLIPVPTV